MSTISIYDENGYQRLMSAIESLRSFAAVAGWDRDAQAEVDKLEGSVTAIDGEIAQTEIALSNAQQARQSKSIVAKLFDSGREIKAAETKLMTLRARRQHYDELAEKLQAQIDFTPNDATEQKALVKELRQYKKELQVKKRELSAEMKEVRVAARQATARIGPSYGSKFVGQMNSAQRRNIRLQKEAALGPREGEQSALERQLLSTDRRILWAERFEG